MSNNGHPTRKQLMLRNVALKLRANGKTVRQIAEICGATEKQVSTALKLAERAA